MSLFPEVGSLVRWSKRPDWGIGQVQSVIGDRVTVNFTEAGKVVLQGPDIVLDLVDPDPL